jgi:hypothetical protein
MTTVDARLFGAPRVESVRKCGDIRTPLAVELGRLVGSRSSSTKKLIVSGAARRCRPGSRLTKPMHLRSGSAIIAPTSTLYR